MAGAAAGFGGGGALRRRTSGLMIAPRAPWRAPPALRRRFPAPVCSGSPTSLRRSIARPRGADLTYRFLTIAVPRRAVPSDDAEAVVLQVPKNCAAAEQTVIL
jgi:hypothetical protein